MDAGTPSSAPSACSGSPAGGIAVPSRGPDIVALASRWFGRPVVPARPRPRPRGASSSPVSGPWPRWGPGCCRTPSTFPGRVVRGRTVRPVVLVGADDGVISTLRLVDVAAGLRMADRNRAERHPPRDGQSQPVEERYRDARRSRRDPRRPRIGCEPSSGASPARRNMATPEPDEAGSDRHGRPSSDGISLATGWRSNRAAMSACRTRTSMTPPAGRPGPRRRDLAPFIGVDGDTLVTYGACRGFFPCPIVSTDLETGARTVLDASAGPAVVVATTDGARLRRRGRDRCRAQPQSSTDTNGGDAVVLSSIPNETWASGPTRSLPAPRPSCRPLRSCSPPTARCRPTGRPPRHDSAISPTERPVPLAEAAR